MFRRFQICILALLLCAAATMSACSDDASSSPQRNFLGGVGEVRCIYDDHNGGWYEDDVYWYIGMRDANNTKKIAKETGKIIELCREPGCSHNSESCLYYQYCGVSGGTLLRSDGENLYLDGNDLTLSKLSQDGTSVPFFTLQSLPNGEAYKSDYFPQYFKHLISLGDTGYLYLDISNMKDFTVEIETQYGKRNPTYQCAMFIQQETGTYEYAPYFRLDGYNNEISTLFWDNTAQWLLFCDHQQQISYMDFALREIIRPMENSTDRIKSSWIVYENGIVYYTAMTGFDCAFNLNSGTRELIERQEAGYSWPRPDGPLYAISAEGELYRTDPLGANCGNLALFPPQTAIVYATETELLLQSGNAHYFYYNTKTDERRELGGGNAAQTETTTPETEKSLRYGFLMKREYFDPDSQTIVSIPVSKYYPLEITEDGASLSVLSKIEGADAAGITAARILFFCDGIIQNTVQNGTEHTALRIPITEDSSAVTEFDLLSTAKAVQGTISYFPYWETGDIPQSEEEAKLADKRFSLAASNLYSMQYQTATPASVQENVSAESLCIDTLELPKEMPHRAYLTTDYTAAPVWRQTLSDDVQLSGVFSLEQGEYCAVLLVDDAPAPAFHRTYSLSLSPAEDSPIVVPIDAAAIPQDGKKHTVRLLVFDLLHDALLDYSPLVVAEYE